MDFLDRDQPIYLAMSGAPTFNVDPLVELFVKAFGRFAASKDVQAILIQYGPITTQTRFVVAFTNQLTLEKFQHLAGQFLIALSDARYVLLGSPGGNELLTDTMRIIAEFMAHTNASRIEASLPNGIELCVTGAEVRRFVTK